MCGIAGIVGRVSSSDRSVVELMNAIQSYRGPDRDKVYEYDGAVLGHRRLSIQDLSSAGHQPMCDESGRYWIIFNGEIYNYKKLKEYFTKKGVKFTSTSDTEVILKYYIVSISLT